MDIDGHTVQLDLSEHQNFSSKKFYLSVEIEHCYS